MEPGLIVDSVGDLQKHGEVLGAQVQPAVGAAEVEGVGSKVSCRVLPKVALAFELARQDSETARRSVAPRPDQRFAGCEADVRLSTEGSEHVRRCAHGEHDIDLVADVLRQRLRVDGDQ